MIEEETQSKLLAQVATPRTDAFLNLMSATSDIMRAAPMAYQNFADFARELERTNVKLYEALEAVLTALRVAYAAAYCGPQSWTREERESLRLEACKADELARAALANKKL